MKYFVEAEIPGQVPQRFSLPETLVRVGSADEAELKLDTASITTLHLTIEARSDGALVRVLDDVHRGFVADGTEQRKAVVPWGAEAFVGGVRLSFLAEEAQKRGTSPWLLLALGAGVTLLGWQGAEAGGARPNDAVDPPSLAMPSVACPEAAPELARAVARREQQAAQAKQERYPFDGSEGLEALAKYQVAEACLLAAGDPDAVGLVKNAREGFQRQLASDYAGLRLRLQLAQAQGRERDVRYPAEALDTLVAPLGVTPYRAWLRSVQQAADARRSAR